MSKFETLSPKYSASDSADAGVALGAHAHTSGPSVLNYLYFSVRMGCSSVGVASADTTRCGACGRWGGSSHQRVSRSVACARAPLHDSGLDEHILVQNQASNIPIK
ncbi:hypothetical protein RR48_11730 [Papilio machaon]|uniref:Uncharacterized protein n=1 Tax=Papilio machaon TaxID=76193 RepID=A0A194QMC0_PAPMA|nr:hypothetical protein RR48_11730 [Papilio machaon]